MKRILLVIIVMLVMSVTLTSCGGGGDKKPSTDAKDGPIKAEISVQAEKDWVPYYKAAIERVVKNNPESKIKVIEVGSFDHLDTMTKTDATNKDIADVFAIPLDRVDGFIKSEVLAQLDAAKIAKELGGFSDFANGLAKGFEVDGKYFGFPFNIETLSVFVNKANAKAANFDYTKPVEFNNLSKDVFLTPIYDLWFAVSFLNAGNINPLTKGADGSLTSDLAKDFKDLTPEQQNAFKSLFKYWKMHFDAKSALLDKATAGAYVDNQFKSGAKGVMRLDGPWATGNLAGFTNKGQDLDVVSMKNVTFNGKPLTHWKSGWGLVVNSRVEEDASKMALAVALVKELVNPKFAEDLFTATGKILENVSVDDYMKTKLGDAQKAVIKSTIESYSGAVSRPVFEEMNKVWGTWENAILSWNSVKPADVEAAYKEVQASFKAMLATK